MFDGYCKKLAASQLRLNKFESNDLEFTDKWRIPTRRSLGGKGKKGKGKGGPWAPEMLFELPYTTCQCTSTLFLVALNSFAMFCFVLFI